MAGLFWLFGATLRTARRAAAVIQACTALLIFLSCRRLGVRRGLAWAAGVAPLVIAQPVYPVASYHWLATLLTMVLLGLCIEMRARTGWVLAAGLTAGLLIAVHQQRGTSLGIGVALIVAVDAWFAGRGTARSQLLWRNLGALAGSALLIVVPLTVWLVVRAGVAPVWYALVTFPLVNYRAVIRIDWGGWLYGVAPAHVYARLLKYSPLALLFTVTMLAVDAARSSRGDPIRIAIQLTIFAVFSIASVAYYPDLIHIAFMVPVFLVVLVAGIEVALGQLRAIPKGAARPEEVGPLQQAGIIDLPRG